MPESGSPEVYVRGFPDGVTAHQVSPGGGHTPVWSRDGLWLFYAVGQQLVAARVATSASFTVSVRDTVLRELGMNLARGHADVDAAPDGSHFLVTPFSFPTDYARTVVVHDWRYELRARTGRGPGSRE